MYWNFDGRHVTFILAGDSTEVETIQLTNVFITVYEREQTIHSSSGILAAHASSCVLADGDDIRLDRLDPLLEQSFQTVCVLCVQLDAT